LLTALEHEQKKVVAGIANSIAPCDESAFGELLEHMSSRRLNNRALLFTMGEAGDREYFVTEGILRTFVNSPEGHEVTMGLYVAPCALSPSISRNIDGISQLSCDALVPSAVASMDSALLIETMMQNSTMQRWGDTVMRTELSLRMQRELGLATHTAKQRLQQFRADFPKLEDLIPHSMIASYLGVTPVTLSRLRNA